MGWDEWESLKATAGDGGAVRMRLNGVQAPDGGKAAGTGDLVVHQDDLGAVGHEAYELFGQLHDQADIAGLGADKDGRGSTMQAAAALKSHGFAMGGQLETTVEMWSAQVKAVLQACAHISNHLDYSQQAHGQDDAQLAAVLRQRNGAAVSVSRLNEYFH
ncbi:hypothetical protein GCM10010218_28700 [Streptomyces mashuensis]|uniref:AG1 protein n=1 Tax=Streptomyces mashuensis TaxID=33904 RepID=A0A919EDJ5_9ACTN|nr:hypothetical protein [Streptomyces mashuensis]GHF45753.1 hypothetical protein GCM10010218_28700 [Streptomyces mashuensis]